jgi:hypothetical protein
MKQVFNTVYEGLINWIVVIADFVIEIQKLKAEAYARKYTKV